MKICGIYTIENIKNKKVYVGQSKNILMRFSNHRYELNNNIHTNLHLQKSWNKYGKENFTFNIIHECSPEELNGKEIYFIGIYNSFEHGYNNTEGGIDSETAKEYGRRMAKITHERRKSTKGKCKECGSEIENNYQKYCSNHKTKCKECGKRLKYGNLCSDCKEWNSIVLNINNYNQIYKDKTIKEKETFKNINL